MLDLLVTNQKEHSSIRLSGGAIVLGRAPKTGGLTHTIQDDYCSAHQLRVEEVAGTGVRLWNLSTKVAVNLSIGRVLSPGATCETGLPVRLHAGKTVIEIEAVKPVPGSPRAEAGHDSEVVPDSDSESADALATIAQPIALQVKPIDRSGAGSGKAKAIDPSTTTATTVSVDWSIAPLSGLEDVPGIDRLMRWFETLVTVQRAAASSDAFFQEAARAVVDLVGLDCGLIIVHEEGHWVPQACHPPESLRSIAISRSVLERVRRERRTYYRNEAGDESTTLAGVSTLVASPIFGGSSSDENGKPKPGGEVVAAVYGVRLMKPGGPLVLIRPLEAQLVQVLAAAVGSGLARRESEFAAARRHVQFEQFFSHELASELDRNPSLLDGHEREVTILVADIRGFSRISEQIGPRETCLLMNDVLERLTAQVHEQGGVVVDYLGDGLLAMWNAPVDQPDHAARACHAALAMVGELPALNARWHGRLKNTLGLGIGINTGTALVGNTGCPRKFKYGPLGHAVNLASRVEGATKPLGVPILITGSTHAQLSTTPGFATRRLCRVRVVGIDSPVDLHELQALDEPAQWFARRDLYESALASYESGQWSEACRILYPMLADHEGQRDLPTLSLIGRAIECLRSNPASFDPVIHLTDK